MYTKSKIQQTLELIEMKQNFKEAVNNILEKYQVEDSIFTWNKWLNEATRGYFVVEGEFDNLNDAISKGGMTIRVINNEKFQTGTIYNQPNLCPEGKEVVFIG